MTILLIDDQPSILSALTTGINWHEMGFTSVLAATSAAKARAILTEHPVDIVVSDIEMPNEDGLSLLSWARSQGMNYECIMLTAHADFFYAKQAITLNVFDYVVQPARFEDIIASVKRAIDKIQSSRQHSSSSPNQKINAAANNIVINNLLDSWPDYETTVIYPQRLEKMLNQMRHFGVDCNGSTPCMLVSLYVPSQISAEASDFSLLCSRFYDLLSTKYDAPGFSCYLTEKRFFAVFIMPLPMSLEVSLAELFSSASSEAGIHAGLSCTAAELRFMKDAMDHLLNSEVKSGAPSSVRFYPFDSDAYLSANSGQGRYQQYIGQIKEYINEHISEPISRNDIADSLHLSPDHVSVVVKTTESMTVKELITSVKMEHARNMLRNTKMPIGTISQKCGYDSFAYFSKIYRDTYNLTPSQERGK
ncbi:MULTISPECIES: response regulator transcription factor [unclassified Butyrivibrio]|uniref:response regulator transcription factor n=1 Tax=unclassified Butyrivibrio TaxID=2639466 RepID=UPI0003B7880D|nr:MULTISPECIES: response regulator [unclassified Butyrivibrio]